MTDHFTTDQYTRVCPGCPMSTDLHPADDSVEIVFGAPARRGDALRLEFTDTDLLLRLIDVCDEARGKLIQHRRGNPDAEPALFLVNTTASAPTGG